MSVRCLVMFSAGLDSTIAVHLLASLGLDVTALHFVLPFESGLGFEHAEVRRAAAGLGVPLRIEEEGAEFLEMVRNPRFGYGKNINPCVDCRIHRLLKAKRIMEETGAAFIATGEVVGQRPMSQKLDKLNLIAKRCDLKGLLLRPLSAKLLAPTIAEERGWVDRAKLLSISGRSRKEQMEYAKQHGLSYQSPAGGCLLTNEGTLRRYIDLRDHDPRFSLPDFKLLAYGRHFRLAPDSWCAVARTDRENDIIAQLFMAGDCRIELAAIPGPITLLRGKATEENVRLAASLCARYSKARDIAQVPITVTCEGDRREITVVPADDELCDRLRV